MSASGRSDLASRTSGAIGVSDQYGPPGPTEEPAMSTLPEIRVGDPIRHEALTVFPLFSESDGGADYLLSDEAIAAGTVTVEEVGEAGSVSNLLVENKGDGRVLFLEGEEL